MSMLHAIQPLFSHKYYDKCNMQLATGELAATCECKVWFPLAVRNAKRNGCVVCCVTALSDAVFNLLANLLFPQSRSFFHHHHSQQSSSSASKWHSFTSLFISSNVSDCIWFGHVCASQKSSRNAIKNNCENIPNTYLIICCNMRMQSMVLACS